MLLNAANAIGLAIRRCDLGARGSISMIKRWPPARIILQCTLLRITQQSSKGRKLVCTGVD